MIKWICVVSLKDRRTGEELRTLVEVDPITTDTEAEIVYKCEEER